jgi:hypothetical protein
MPIEIKELIVKGTVESEDASQQVDVVELIDTKLANAPSKCGLDKGNLIEECVQAVLQELRKQSDY